MLAENYGFPPTYTLILKSIMPVGKLTFLDLGCGTGAAGNLLNPKKIHQFTGVDIYKPYLNICKKKGNYQKLIQADIIKMKFKKESFDVVLLLQVIEHLGKRAGIELLRKATKIAKKSIVVSVPNGYSYQEEYDGSTYHKHVSSWSVSDLRRLGFKVYGQGLKFIYGSKSYGGGQGANWWQKIIVPLTVTMLPVTLIYPHIGAQLIGVKYLDGK